MNTTEFLSISSLIVPDREALIFEDKRITYLELQSRVNRLANSLAALGVGPGDRVATLQVNCNEYIEAYFATAKLDAVYVPMNFRARADELAYMINDAGPKVVMVGARYVDLVKECSKEVDCVENYVALEDPVEGWQHYDSLLEAGEDEERFPEADADDLTIIMFTAGTTGSPKGVMLSHDSFSSYILSNVTPADPDADDRNIITVPLYHIAGVQAVMAAIYGGRRLIIQRQFNAVEWMSLVAKERANRAMMVPTMLKMLMDSPEFHQHDLSSLEVITYGAAPMPLEVIKRAIAEFPGTHFINAFGQTETAATITMLPPDAHILDGTDEENEIKLKRLSSIGKPLDDVEVQIFDEDGAPVVVGEVGEIAARGSRLMKGYWHQESATAETIRGGWLFTGDLGYEDDEGYIFLAGRAKDFIKRGGEMISPEEVEQVLQSHPAVDEAAIIGVTDVDWGERVRAIVVLKNGQTAGEDEIIEFCRQRLSSYKKPESVVFIDELPRNPLGKVLKRVLREEHDYPVEAGG
ncbi:MAG: long-chain-fatty-acid--CoA ligase [Chloroflexi bacterium]|nr:long-chain-fatty-acid--CoA ligase [Chloroflexota bacterium]MDA1226778.1 long-chain-fatty-acid--CoA ligase [Chloroflexota bacterium]